MTRHTALMLRNHPDYDQAEGHGIDVTATGPHPNGKWAGWISFWRDKRPHISPLVLTDPSYDTAEEAKAAMTRLIEDVRKTDVMEAK